jgi:hypothetical protein
MFGCVRKLGCLVVLLLAAVLYLTRGLWYERVRARIDGREAVEVTSSGWEPLSEAAGRRAERSVRSLGGSSGPVYVSLSPGELASYVFLSLGDQLPASAQDARAAVVGDRIYLKTTMALADLGGAAALGPLGGFMADRDTVQLGGDFEVLRPGTAQFRVREIKLRDFTVPAALIPRLVGRLRREAPEGVAPDALPLRTPEHIGDVRIAKGRITLYRTSR